MKNKSQNIKRDITLQEIAKFPDTPILTLAKKIYKENKSVFKDVEDARYIIRYYKGKSGDVNRARVERTTGAVFEKTEPVFNPFKMPKSHADEWLDYILPTMQ